MPRFRITQELIETIDVEAVDAEEARDIALNTPLDDWEGVCTNFQIKEISD